MSATINPDDLIDMGELADLLGVKVSTLRVMRSDPGRHRRVDGLPDPIRLIGRSPVWTRADIETWMSD